MRSCTECRNQVTRDTLSNYHMTSSGRDDIFLKEVITYHCMLNKGGCGATFTGFQCMGPLCDLIETLPKDKGIYLLAFNKESKWYVKKGHNPE